MAHSPPPLHHLLFPPKPTDEGREREGSLPPPSQPAIRLFPWRVLRLCHGCPAADPRTTSRRSPGPRAKGRRWWWWEKWPRGKRPKEKRDNTGERQWEKGGTGRHEEEVEDRRWPGERKKERGWKVALSHSPPEARDADSSHPQRACLRPASFLLLLYALFFSTRTSFSFLFLSSRGRWVFRLHTLLFRKTKQLLQLLHPPNQPCIRRGLSPHQRRGGKVRWRGKRTATVLDSSEREGLSQSQRAMDGGRRTRRNAGGRKR